MSNKDQTDLTKLALRFREKDLPEMMKEAQGFFDKMAENPNLTAQQHSFLQEMATIRHYIHCHPEQIFFETNLQIKLSAYMGYIAHQESINELGIDFPYDICRQYSELTHYALNENYKPKELVVNITIFPSSSGKNTLIIMVAPLFL